MSRKNIPVDVYALPTEQRQQLFLALLDADPTLPNVLNSEQRRQLYVVLITIDSSLVGPPSLDARSAVHGITNEQVINCLRIIYDNKLHYSSLKDLQ